MSALNKFSKNKEDKEMDDDEMSKFKEKFKFLLHVYTESIKKRK